MTLTEYDGVALMLVVEDFDANDGDPGDAVSVTPPVVPFRLTA